MFAAQMIGTTLALGLLSATSGIFIPAKAPSYACKSSPFLLEVASGEYYTDWFLVLDETNKSHASWTPHQSGGTQFCLTSQGYLAIAGAGADYYTEEVNGTIAYLTGKTASQIFFDLPATALKGNPLECKIKNGYFNCKAAGGLVAFYEQNGYAYFGKKNAPNGLTMLNTPDPYA